MSTRANSHLKKEVHFLNRLQTPGNKDAPTRFREELMQGQDKPTAQYIEHRRDANTNQIEKHIYIIYDFEADVHTLTRMPNHVEADMLQVDENNNAYEDCLTNTFRHNGYDVVDEFCDWLFTSENYNNTVSAHNQAGYDGRFILQWCLKRVLYPTQYIRQGSRSMYMAFQKHRL